eukprot:scaffold5066_cov403-Prasinococcus_capsulatus_cf.AAC.5
MRPTLGLRPYLLLSLQSQAVSVLCRLGSGVSSLRSWQGHLWRRCRIERLICGSLAGQSSQQQREPLERTAAHGLVQTQAIF